MPGQKLERKVESLKYVSNMLVLGVVRDVDDFNVHVSLPNQKTGFVSVSDVSRASSRILENDSDSDGEIPMLKDVYSAGQVLMLRVIGYERNNGKKRLKLTIVPELVNEFRSTATLEVGNPIMATVDSVEDHGYVVSFGIKETCGFLPADCLANKRLVVNQTVLLWVVKVEKDDGAQHQRQIVSCTIDKNLGMTPLNGKHQITISSLVPGLLVNAKVLQCSKSGAVVKFCQVYTGSIEPFSMPLEKDATSFKQGTAVQARISSVNYETKQIFLSMKPHIVELNPDLAMEKFLARGGVGTFIKDARIVTVISDTGCLLQIENDYGFIYKSRLINETENSDKASKALKKIEQQESKVIPLVRCIGFDLFDNLLQLSMQPRLLDSPLYSYSDLKPGMIVKGEITRIDDSGVLIQITPEIRGLIPRLHVADVAISLPNRKYKVGQLIKAQVLYADCKLKKAYLTRKPSLINSKYAPLLDVDSAAVDMLVTGVVVSLLDNGALVQFYSNLRAFVPASQYGEKRSYEVGQVVDCRLIYVNKAEERLAASFILTDKSVKLSDKRLLHSKVYKAILQARDGANWVVDVYTGKDATESVRAVLPEDSVSDIAKLNSLVQGSQLLVPKLKCSVVVTKGGSSSTLPTVSTKPILREVAESYGATLQKHTCVAGVVIKVQKEGCVVQVFNQRLSYFTPLRQMALRYVARASEVVEVGQTVIGKVIDAEKRLLSFKDVPIQLLDFFRFQPLLQRLSPLEFILNGKFSENVICGDFSATVTKVVTGDRIVAKLTGDTLGYSVCVKASQLPLEKSFKNYRTGDSISGIILYRDPLKKIVYGSLKLRKIEAFDSVNEGVVEHIEDDVVCVSDVDQRHFVGVCAAKRVFFDCEPLSKSFSVGQRVRLIASNLIPNVYFAQAHDVSKKRKQTSDDTDKSLKRSKETPVVEVGRVYSGEVTNIAENAGVFVRLSNGLSGRIMISNLSDEYIKDWQAVYGIGDRVQVCVMDYDPATQKLELSSKKSAIDPSAVIDYGSLSVGQSYDGIIRKVLGVGLIIVIKGSRLSGLCHKSQVELASSTDDLTAYYKPGDLVRAQVIKLNDAEKRISFSLLPQSCASVETENASKELSLLPKAGEQPEEEQISESSDDSESVIESVNGSVKSESEELMDNEESVYMSAAESQHLSEAEEEFVWKDEEVLLPLASVASEASEASDTLSKRVVPTGTTTVMSEKQIREKEAELLSYKKPQSVEEFEKWVAREPNSSYVWIQFMAYMLATGEPEQARAVGRRALERINFRLEDEKMNVWMALLNLENSVGDATSLETLFNEAVLCNDSKTMHIKLAAMFEQSNKLKSAHEAYQRLLKKFSRSCKVYLLAAEFYVSQRKHSMARKLLAQALRQLETRKHVKVRLLFALLEYKKMEPERGRTMFEQLLSEFPKRADLWNVYLDQELTQSKPNVQHIRRIYQRITSRKFSSKIIKNFFKRFLEFEREFGDESSVESVKQSAMEYVEAHLS